MPTTTDSPAFVRWARSRLAGMLGVRNDGVRDLWGTLGYPQSVTTDDMMNMYLRGGIANRIVRAFPQATWREMPQISDEQGSSDEEGEDFSLFTESVNRLIRERSVLSYMERADRLAGIGQFGVLLMGFDGAEPLDRPVQGQRRLIYLAAYGEPNVMVSTWDQNPSSERFGLPELYTVQSGSLAGKTASRRSLTVHWSRVIHVAEQLDQDEVYGTPRLLPVYNHLLDLEKVLGSSAETFWLNARGGLALTADKDAKLDETALADLKEQAFEFENQLRRILAMQGTTAQSITTNVADPSPNVERLLDLIAGTTSIPKRILIGSERGELASSQDENNFAARVDERQNTFATPRMLRPFVQRMIETGNVTSPEGEWWPEWPDSSSLSPERQAARAVQISQAIATYSNAIGADELVPAEEFRSDVLGLPPTSEYEPEDEEELEEDDEEVAEQFERGSVVPLPSAARRARIVNATPRTLYVRRDVENAEAIRQHFRSQGIDPMTPADEMHVTIAYSRTPIDWMRVEPSWNQEEDGRLIVPAGGARLMELFGRDYPRRVLVLLFSSSRLSWRHEDMRNAGASWDFPDFEPHVTVSYDVAQSWGDEHQAWAERLRELEPWQGAIELGPEIFEELREDWREGLVENAAE